jgi:hypothetical protein
MKPIHLALGLFLLTSACSPLPTIHRLDSAQVKMAAASCHLPFPEGDWEFIHLIETTMTGGQTGFLYGAVVFSSEDQRIQAAIMTMEGMTLFQAEYKAKLMVHRALAPFDSTHFAAGLMDDIRLLFFQPPGEPAKVGTLASDTFICRYDLSGNDTIDVIILPDKGWEIRRYDANRVRVRTIEACELKKMESENAVLIPEKVTLTAYGVSKYRLILNLISARSLNARQ